MSKLLSKIKQSKVGRLGAVVLAAVSTACMGCISAFAEDTSSTATLKNAMSTAFESIKSDAISFFAVALPVALSIMGIVIAVKLGIKFFKKFSNG